MPRVYGLSLVITLVASATSTPELVATSETLRAEWIADTDTKGMNAEEDFLNNFRVLMGTQRAGRF